MRHPKGVLLAEISSDPAAGVTIFAAFGAGLVSFLSPCVLPLVPGYLSAVSGVSPAELDDAGWRRVLVPSLLFVASLFVTRLNREWHVDALLERAGRGGPVVAGAAFAIAWTPCIGPTLGAILSAAALAGSAGRGAFLLAVYSAGLAVPFLLTAVAFSRMTTAFAVLKRHYRVIVAVGGVILIAMGVLIWTDELTRLNAEVQSSLSEVGLDFYNF